MEITEKTALEILATQIDHTYKNLILAIMIKHKKKEMLYTKFKSPNDFALWFYLLVENSSESDEVNSLARLTLEETEKANIISLNFIDTISTLFPSEQMGKEPQND